jgi:predicted acetyltransferase
MKQVRQTVRLISPHLDLLEGYARALEAGWSPETSPAAKHNVAADHLELIRRGSATFVSGLAAENRTTRRLLDGTATPEIAERIYWLSDRDFCGVISLRYVSGSLDLPAQVSGHVSYAVVPWKRGRGYAISALKQLLPIAHDLGLPKLLVTTHENNESSRRVIEACGAVFSEAVPHPSQPGKRRLLFWLCTSSCS